MADNHYDDETALPRPGSADGAITDADHLLVEHTSAGEPGQIAATDDPDATRAEIDRTRARMSRTLDSIESALLRKKEQIQERLDVMAPVRQRPLVSVGAVFGASLVLGYLTGGGSDDDEDGRTSLAGYGATGMPLPLAAHLDDDEAEMRAELWEKRARRLLRVARSQEEELSALRAEYDDDEETTGLRALGNSASEMRDGVLAAVAGFLTEAFDKLRDGAGTIAEVAHDGYDAVREHAGDVKDSAGGLAHDHLGVGKTRSEKLVDGVKDLAHDHLGIGKTPTEKLADAVKGKASDALDAVKGKIEDLRG
jgi:ElaB/YqjD/DUF883 family membrane-anchored ribosome-binding protein